MKPQHKESSIQDQAAQWLTELEDAGTRKRAACLAWLKESPEHVKEFLFMTAMWEGLSGVDSQRRMDVNALLAEATATVVQLQTEDGGHTRERSGWRTHWRLAAGVAAVLIVAVAIWIPQVYNGVSIYGTAIGEQRSVKLPDGSVVYLNTQSRIAVTFNDSERVIRLMQGEALFTAARDARRPFRVRAAGKIIQALGTQFNVYLRAGDTTVSVIEGAVRIGEELKVQAGEAVRVAGNGQMVKLSAPDLDKAIAWRQRQLIFRGDTLESVATEVNRYNETLQIRIEDATARARRMIGVFAADDPESLIQFLEKEGDLAIQRRGTEILIRSR